MKKIAITFILSIYPIVFFGQNKEPLGNKEEKNAEFPGGIPVFMKYISTSIDLSGIHGNKKEETAKIKFDILEDSTVTNAKCVNYTSVQICNLGIKAVLNSPKWNPATIDGKAIKNSFIVPIKVNY